MSEQQPMFKGFGDSWYADKREADCSYEYERWKRYGHYTGRIRFKDGRIVDVICESATVVDGALQINYAFRRDDSAECKPSPGLAALIAPGEWREFWIQSAMQGGDTCVVLNSEWWPERADQCAELPTTDKAAERAKMTPRLRLEILQRDRFACCLCGRTQKHGVSLHVDHIIAIANGGTTVRENLQTLCEDCNQAKAANPIAGCV